jgi:5-methyltetrahydropteroyltriglutamate--homocysteine methyltransferase
VRSQLRAKASLCCSPSDREEIRDRILDAARYIEVEQLGTTDYCGFWSRRYDGSTSRQKAFAKLRSRVDVEGMALAEETINGR